MVSEKNDKEEAEAKSPRDVMIDVVFYAVVCLAATLITYYVAFPKAGAASAFYAALAVLLATAVAAPLANRISSGES